MITDEELGPIVVLKPRTDGAKIMDFAGYAGAIAYTKGWSN